MFGYCSLALLGGLKLNENNLKLFFIYRAVNTTPELWKIVFQGNPKWLLKLHFYLEALWASQFLGQCKGNFCKSGTSQLYLINNEKSKRKAHITKWNTFWLLVWSWNQHCLLWIRELLMQAPWKPIQILWHSFKHDHVVSQFCLVSWGYLKTWLSVFFLSKNS